MLGYFSFLFPFLLCFFFIYVFVFQPQCLGTLSLRGDVYVRLFTSIICLLGLGILCLLGLPFLSLQGYLSLYK
jgi:hypothetical protein